MLMHAMGSCMVYYVTWQYAIKSIDPRRPEDRLYWRAKKLKIQFEKAN